ncbi:MAG TPA: hypothetical protein VFH78_08120 [Candidatus Thermoplasmatota archaeon]|nr:hypothetical protein [Candidatus Thermoplasmatota archaeon]
MPDLAALPTAESLLAVVKARLPRAALAGDDAPVLEGAAYIGEWMRQRAAAAWVSEGPYEPHLQLVDDSHAIVYLLPLVQLVRTAATAGYDGMASMLRDVLDDVARPATRAPLEELRVRPEHERAQVVAWARANRDVEHATRAALWRRCSVCSRIDERALTLHRPGDDWEGDAATAASILAANPFECPCGGPPGAVTRFLMIRHADGGLHLGDIYVANTHTRVGCWTIHDEEVEPFDALALTKDEMLVG